jgi:intraflagellar transport protein 172
VTHHGTRYVDLTEAIQEGDASLIDNSDFADATNVPFDTVLPTQQYLPDEDAREDVKTWVLSVCMDKSIEQRLPPPNKAQGTIYEGLFASSLPQCIVTGYPIQPREMLEVNNSRAIRRDWNQYVSRIKKCPWTGQPQNPYY